MQDDMQSLPVGKLHVWGILYWPRHRACMKRIAEAMHLCSATGRKPYLEGVVVPSRAVEGDDWSSVIDGQTAETLVQGGNPAEESSQHPIATPFARASVHRSIGEPLKTITLVVLIRSPFPSFWMILALLCVHDDSIMNDLESSNACTRMNCIFILLSSLLQRLSVHRCQAREGTVYCVQEGSGCTKLLRRYYTAKGQASPAY